MKEIEVTLLITTINGVVSQTFGPRVRILFGITKEVIRQKCENNIIIQ